MNGTRIDTRTRLELPPTDVDDDLSRVNAGRLERLLEHSSQSDAQPLALFAKMRVDVWCLIAVERQVIDGNQDLAVVEVQSDSLLVQRRLGPLNDILLLHGHFFLCPDTVHLSGLFQLGHQPWEDNLGLAVAKDKVASGPSIGLSQAEYRLEEEEQSKRGRPVKVCEARAGCRLTSLLGLATSTSIGVSRWG